MRHHSQTENDGLLLFGRRVSAVQTLHDLGTARGWQAEPWSPTFIEEDDRPQLLHSPDAMSQSWHQRQVMRPCRLEGDGTSPSSSAPRLMIASTTGLPSLYYVEWHYIDFVL